jgi:hypothetical protein
MAAHDPVSNSLSADRKTARVAGIGSDQKMARRAQIQPLS